jgi:hypothetical protein
LAWLFTSSLKSRYEQTFFVNPENNTIDTRQLLEPLTGITSFFPALI